ncbi:MAG TPA: hypothetical protein VMH35_17865 [Streptosporangiaceae bacterium]|nr:hypothetical protein [Streptosporangiaceae bacterium]
MTLLTAAGRAFAVGGCDPDVWPAPLGPPVADGCAGATGWLAGCAGATGWLAGCAALGWAGVVWAGLGCVELSGAAADWTGAG